MKDRPLKKVDERIKETCDSTAATVFITGLSRCVDISSEEVGIFKEKVDCQNPPSIRLLCIYSLKQFKF